jgi:hypothetical protein
MPFYNIVSEKQGIIFSVQPKCGCSTIKNWVQEQNGFQYIGTYMINDYELQSSAYKNYEKLLVVRNLYDRLISYFSLFVISGIYKDLWIHADKEKNISLIHNSFSQMVFILKDLPTEKYQHHLVPQTAGIDVKLYDAIINIKELNEYFEKRKLPQAKLINRLDRYDYQQSVVEFFPNEFMANKIPFAENFYDDELIKNTEEKIYLDDYTLLNEHL